MLLGCSTVEVKTISTASPVEGSDGNVILIYNEGGRVIDYVKTVTIKTKAMARGNGKLEPYLTHTEISVDSPGGKSLKFKTGSIGEGATVSSEQLIELFKTVQQLPAILAVL